MRSSPLCTAFGTTILEHTWTFNIHKVRVGGLYETLELVLLLFVLGRRVEEIDGESL